MKVTSPTASQAEFARMHDVSRKTVSLWKQDGYLVLTSDGKVDVKASERKLAGRPFEYRGGVTKGPKPSNNPHPVTGNTDPENEVTSTAAQAAEQQAAMIRTLCYNDFDRGALWMAHEMIRQIGGLGAVSVVSSGGSCATAYAVEKVLSLAMLQAVEDRLIETRRGPFADGRGGHPVWPDPNQCARPNWPSLAAEAGERLDIAGWERAWLKLEVALNPSRPDAVN